MNCELAYPTKIQNGAINLESMPTQAPSNGAFLVAFHTTLKRRVSQHLDQQKKLCRVYLLVNKIVFTCK